MPFNLSRDEEIIEELEYTEKYGWLYGITMPLSSLIFLLLSWNRWDDLDKYPTWIVFPIVAIVTYGITRIIGIIKKTNS